MMRKFYSRLIVVFALMLIGITGAWADTQSTRTSEFLPRVVDFELQPGKMYIVQPATSDPIEEGFRVVTLDASAANSGKLNGLRVAKMPTPANGKQAPILFIPADVKLVVKGANANGMNGAGAGIYVPSGAELIITGAGQLVATGGNAANGGNGEDGHNPKDVPFTAPGIKDFAYWVDVLEKSGNMEYSGRGGRGGNGGGGAGAGIGGIGGAGGVGGAGGAAVRFQDAGESSSSRKDGKPGAKGGNGSDGAAMGKVSIMGTVNVTATAGAAATQVSTGGQQGYSFWHRTTGTIITTAHNIAGGGGAGAGGGAGYGATYGIGGGGAGAGAGGGGGSGAVDWREILGNTIAGVDNNSCRAASGTPGTGNENGGAATTNRNRDDGAVNGNFTKVGGTGGAAGAAGVAGGNGTLYIASTANVDGSHEASKEDARPNDMNITLTFKNNEFAAKKNDNTDVAVGATVGTKNDVIIGDPLPNAEIATYQLHADSKYFAGYYTADQGLGNRMYKGTITDSKLDAVASAVPFAQNTTLYAHFSHNQHRVNWDYSYIDGDNSLKTLEVGSTRIEYGKLIFHFRDGSNDYRVLHAKPFTGAHGTQPFVVPGPSSYPLSGHTISSGNITLTGNGGQTSSTIIELTDAGTQSEPNLAIFTIDLTDEQLAQFISYEFVPMSSSTGEASSSSWITTTNAQGQVTTFSFIGNTGENVFPLQWTVTLKDLAKYPEAIFAQPMFFDTAVSKYQAISQTSHTLGVECAMTPVAENAPVGQGSSRTYTFSYPVWKNDGATTPAEFSYKLGLTGFRLGVQTYFLNETEHNVPLAHYISADNDVVTFTSYNDRSNDRIEMTLGREDIPVLRLDANGGTLDNGQPELVVTTYGGTIAAPKTAFPASRAGYTFLGWADSNTATEASTTYNSPLNNYKETKTIYAVWKNAIAPAITTQGISYYDNEGVTGAKVSVAVHGANGSKITSVKYIITDTADEPSEEDWNNSSKATTVDITEAESVNCDLNIEGHSKGYLHIKATDDGNLSTVVNSPKLKLDGFAPQYTIYPTGNVCNFVSKITLTDNVALDEVYVKVGTGSYEKITNETVGAAVWITKTNDKNWVVNIPIPADNTGLTYSFYAVDAAGNQTVPYEDFVTMYHDHSWETTGHEGMTYDKGTDTYTKVTYYNCSHQCGHIWIEGYKVGDTTFGKPSDSATGENPGYSHTSTLTTKTDDEKLYQEQGLMRDATNNFLEGYGTVVISNAAGEIVGFDHGINNAITTTNSKAEGTYTFTLLDNTNIEWSGSAATGTSVISATTINKPVVIDLNGHGLLVNGSATGETAITGAYGTDVTILLKDDGVTDYANGSKVTGLPIKYVRNFATAARQGKWQALYLPFDVATSKFTGDGVDYTFGTLQSVEIDQEKNTAKLVINKETASLTAFEPYFVKSSKGTLQVTVTTELKPYTAPAKKTIGEQGSPYSIKGSLNADNNKATAESTYWVLTNGGAFSWAKAGSHQRPYHWVIFDSDWTKPTVTPARTLSIIEVEDDPTAIRDITVDEAEQAEAAVYSLSGQRMPAGATLPSGIYVRNGKKIYVK